MARDDTSTARAWMIQTVLIVLVVYFYILMEWLFFVTKPSFMSSVSLSGRVKMLLAAPAPFAVMAAALSLLCMILTRLIRERRFNMVCMGIVRAAAAVVLAAAFLLLIDNFTYTVFDFGIRLAAGVWKIAYGILLLLLIVLSFRLLKSIGGVLAPPVAHRTVVIVTAAVMAVSVIAMLSARGSSGPADIGGGSVARLEDRPYIFLISSDGLNAGHMSLYGYHRKTTPYLDRLAGDALVCENCFTNAGTSGASIASMLTGKLPTQTGLIYPPEILKGIDAYQHLPGILRSCGYKNIDISVRHHADPEDLNMRNSFHWANFRQLKDTRESTPLASLLGQESSYFIQRMRERVTERLLHVAGRRAMEDPLGEVVGKKGREFGKDAERIKSFFKHVRSSNSPLFIHMHLLGTHGPMFDPARKVFSRGKFQGEPWMDDFYDDAILTFDNQVKMIVGGLTKRKIRDRSVVVILTDHGQGFTVSERLPLIFLFPGGRHRGRITSNGQYLDVAATILDYIGVEQPDWMGGTSLISGEIKPDRLIFTANPKHRIILDGDGQRVASRSVPKPPFYSLKAMGAFYCHNYYELDLERLLLDVSDIEGHTAPCPEEELPDPQEIGRAIVEHLHRNGYDTSSIKSPLPVRITR